MANDQRQDALRSLPSVDEVLQHPAILSLGESVPRGCVTRYVREAIQSCRQAILADRPCEASTDAVARAAAARARVLESRSLRRVVNASGVVVHTNLGRSVLAPQAVQAVVDAACGYSTLEYNAQERARGSRHDHCEQLICALTGAEAAIAVNNNAAAVMMVLSEFAAQGEGIVSRGELVEIGGSFRIPDIMAQSHATMVEVGATNKTHLSDYERAITPQTKMLLKVHTSNYRLIGFTESVGIEQLRTLADAENARRASEGNQQQVLVYEDQGSGALLRLDCFGTYAEPTVAESVAAGCDLVSFSGDKLLGGPQAGIIVGSKRNIDRLKKNPLARALRLDKMTLAALEATLRLYLEPESALATIPTLRMLTETPQDVQVRAEQLQALLRDAIDPAWATFELEQEISRAGGGALPMCDILTCVVRMDFKYGSAQECEAYLTAQRETPIVCRIKRDSALFDARTILDAREMGLIVDGIRDYFDQEGTR